MSAVLSGNRNFEGRVHPEVRANYLASPPLVVAYALAGKMDIDWDTEPLGNGRDGKPVFLKDIWPTHEEVAAVIEKSIKKESFERIYGSVFEGDASWKALQRADRRPLRVGRQFHLHREPAVLRRHDDDAAAGARDHRGARAGAARRQHHHRPHLARPATSRRIRPPGKYLMEHGVEPKDFNSYGSRRGHHEVMMRGTFANVRLQEPAHPAARGRRVSRAASRGTCPDGPQTSIFDAAMAYQKDGVPLVVIAGKEYGSGSSRDWAAKGTNLLGVKAVIAESYERIHRSNLVGMGVLPLQFKPGESAASLGLTGEEVFDIARVGGRAGQELRGRQRGS